MAADLKAQIDITADASGVEAGVKGAKKSLAGLGAAAAAAGKEGATGVEKIGAGGEKAAKKVDASTKSLIGSIQRVTAATEAGGKSTAEYYRVLASQRGVDTAALKPYLDQLDAVQAKQVAATGALRKGGIQFNEYGLSVKQTSAALRQVPAQITDIIVSLQGGQAPLTVLLQQGGQLKDIFGGVVPAAKALGGAVLGLINPFTVALGAAAGLGFAFFKGSQEAKEYSKAIVLSGNAIGVTAGQLQGYAEAISEVTGTQGGAAAALAQFVQFGKVGAQNLQEFTQAAIKFEKATGSAVEDTVKQFAELAKAPVEASVKLNEQINFLTADIYKQIKALEDQGRTTEAAALAQKTFADAINGRTGQIVSNLGLIERAWLKIKGAISGAADAALDVGRQVSPKDIADDRRQQIGNLERLIAQGDGGPQTVARRQALLESRKQELSFLQETERVIRRSTDADSTRAQQVKARISFDKDGEKFLSDNAKLEREIAQIRKTGLDAGASELEIQKRIADVRAKANKTGSAGTGENEVAGLRARIAEEQNLILRLKERGVEAEKLTSGEQAVLKIQEELKTSISGVARAQKVKALAVAEELAGVEKIRVAEESRIKGLKESQAELLKQIEATDRSGQSILQQAQSQEAANTVFGKGRTAIEELTLAQLQSTLAQVDATDSADPAYIASLNNKIAVQKRFVAALKGADFKGLQEQQNEYNRSIGEQLRLMQEEVSLSGLTAVQREQIVATRKVELDLAKRIAEIDRSGIEESLKEDLRSQARATASREIQVESARVIEKEFQKTADSINNSITDALLRGFESGKDFAKNFRDTLVNMFKTMVLRPIISAVVNPVAQGVTGALGLAGGANAGQGGGLAGLGNLANTASNLYSAASSIATVGTQVLAGSMSLANAAGTIAANATGTGLTGLLATNGAYGTAAAGTASAAAGGAASALAAIPVVGWVALAAVAAYAIFGKKGGGPKTESGGGYGIGGYMNSGGPTLEYAKGIEAGYAGLAKQLGLNSALSVGAFTSQDPKGDSMTQVEVLAALNGQRIYGRGERLGGVENVGRSQEELKAVLAEETTRVMFAALRASELPEQYKAYLDTMTSSVESMNAAISQVVAVKQFGDALARLPFENLKELGFNASAGLLAAAGSMENMISALTTYYDLYYSEAERLAQSQKDMARILRSINIELPRTKDEFRGIVEALDLNTESGRAAYVTLLNLAPQFAASADLVSQFAQETAKKLISTFTVKGKLLPALDASSLKLDKLTGAIVQSGESAGYISRLFLDVSSGLIGFGSVTKTLTGGLTDAQKSALALSREIEALEDNADKARIDFAGLSAALAGFDTETFITTVSLAFEGLAERISRVIDSIGDERIAVREAALQIINPAVMSRDAILRSIAGVSVNAPGNAGLSAAQESLRQSDAAVAARQAALVQAKAQSPSTAALDSTRAALTAAQNATAAAQSEVDRYRVIEGGKFNWWLDQAFAGNDLRGMVPDPSGERNAQNTVFNLQAAQRNEAPLRSPYEQALAAYGNEAAANAQKVAAAQSLLNSAVAEQTRAVASARAAQLAYVASIQDFAIDASKAVTRLGKLREETVKYFEAQKQLADLMQNSANQLRKTVNDFRFGQLDPQQQFDDLQTRFAKAYAMALSTDGSVLAGYGDQLNGLINPLLDKAREIYASDGEFNTFAATTLARAENIAGRIDALTPKDYAADSLQMLASIDATLAALDASSKSAEKIIAEAVTAGSEKTAAGLRAVIAALTNQTIPGFAAGGTFSGGLRIVGENGPELEATGPSRILSSSQTMSLLSGGAYNMASELSALRQEVSNLRLEAQATAANTSRIARQGDRNEIDGLNIRNDKDAPIYTKAV